MVKRTPPIKQFTRKQFLQLSAASAAGMLVGCQRQASNAPPKNPGGLSRIVQTHGKGVWAGDDLSPVVLRRMLDEAITRLTGADDARGAWASLFSPKDRVAVKVNAFYNSLIWTHVPLVTAVTDCLQEAGVPADRIVVYDQTSDELTTAGFAVNRDGAGVRCHGSDKSYKDFTDIGGTSARLSPILMDCTALINMPVLKAHMLSGITFALKNHFGSTETPGMLHSSIAAKIAQLNALAEIKDRTRLVIGDLLEANLAYGYSFPYWTADYRGDSILMSFDPVAHDTVGLEILNRLLADQGQPDTPLTDTANRCLTEAAALNLGTNLPEKMERVELDV
jgi:uncharacterized protein (DUF362 family)